MSLSSLLLCTAALIQFVNAEVNVSQIHLSLSGDAAIMGLDYVSDADSSSSFVQFKMNTDDGEEDAGLVTSSQFSYFENIGYLHRAQLSPLEPSAQYMYRIGDGISDWSKWYPFNSGPYNRPNFQRRGEESSTEEGGTADKNNNGIAVVYADLGLNNGLSTERLLKEGEEGIFDYAVHIGDISYDLFSENSAVGNEYMNLMAPITEKYPLNVAEGNHERGDNFTEYNLRFKATQDLAGEKSKSHSNHYYSYDVGLIHYVVVSSEVYSYPLSASSGPSPFTAQEQLAWLEQDLIYANEAVQREAVPWIVLLAHRPWYTMLEGFSQFDDLACKYGVDLYITGHVHNYQRWLPMRISAVSKVIGRKERQEGERSGGGGEEEEQDINILSNPIPSDVDHDCVSDDKHTYTNPRYMPVIVAGSTGCHSPLPRVACPVMQAGSKLLLHDSLADCSAAYGFGHMQAVNSTHLYWEFVQSHIAQSVKEETETVSAGSNNAEKERSDTSNIPERDVLSVVRIMGSRNNNDNNNNNNLALNELYRPFSAAEKDEIAQAFEPLFDAAAAGPITRDIFLNTVDEINEQQRQREESIQVELGKESDASAAAATATGGNSVEFEFAGRAASSRLVRDYLWIRQDNHGARDYC